MKPSALSCVEAACFICSSHPLELKLKSKPLPLRTVGYALKVAFGAMCQSALVRYTCDHPVSKLSENMNMYSCNSFGYLGLDSKVNTLESN
jgi:hypothetical protein